MEKFNVMGGQCYRLQPSRLASQGRMIWATVSIKAIRGNGKMGERVCCCCLAPSSTCTNAEEHWSRQMQGRIENLDGQGP